MVSGPGLERNYFYSVRPALALGGVLANLESLNVGISYQRKGAKIAQPSAEARQIISAYEALFGPLSFSKNIPAMADIANNESGLAERLNADYHDTQARIDQWIVLPRDADDRVRMESSDLATMRAAAAVLVESYVTNKILADSDRNEQLAFWSRMRIREGDWQSLTDSILTSVFGKNILTPLDGEGNDFVISIHDTKVEDWLDGIIRGYTPEAHPMVVDQTPRDSGPKAQVEQAPQFTLVGGTQICKNLLAPEWWNKHL
jgi:hypothetical protein